MTPTGEVMLDAKSIDGPNAPGMEVVPAGAHWGLDPRAPSPGAGAVLWAQGFLETAAAAARRGPAWEEAAGNLEPGASLLLAAGTHSGFAGWVGTHSGLVEGARSGGSRARGEGVLGAPWVGQGPAGDWGASLAAVGQGRAPGKGPGLLHEGWWLLLWLEGGCHARPLHLCISLHMCTIAASIASFPADLVARQAANSLLANLANHPLKQGETKP